MALKNGNNLYIASGLLLVSGVLYIVANALPMWSKASVEPASAKIGLWKACDDICYDISSKANSKNMAARAFVTISCILWAAAIGSILSIRFADENLQGRIMLLAKGLGIACLISGIIGVALGIHFAMHWTKSRVATIGLDEVSIKMGAASILAIIALVFNLAGAIVTFFIN